MRLTCSGMRKPIGITNANSFTDLLRVLLHLRVNSSFYKIPSKQTCTAVYR
ncbi:hypothetical protein Hanom_Chr15g01367491 [Helianthus anomalus]